MHVEIEHMNSKNSVVSCVPVIHGPIFPMLFRGRVECSCTCRVGTVRGEYHDGT